MVDALLVCFAGLIGLCLVILTVTVVATARDVRQAARRIHAILPLAERTLEESRRTLARAGRLLARADVTGRYVESMVHRACDAAAGAVAQVLRWTDRARAWWPERVSNGAGAGPRLHARRHKTQRGGEHG